MASTGKFSERTHSGPSVSARRSLRDERLEFDEASHSYTFLPDPDLPLVSITTLIHEFSHHFDAESTAERIGARDGESAADLIAQWKAKGEEASRIGNIVHAEAERVCEQMMECHGFKTRLKSFPDPELGYVRGLYRFFTDNPSIMSGWSIPEVRVVSPEWNICGTADLVCSWRGVPSLLDFKVSENINFAGYAQTLYSPWNCFPDTNAYHYLLQLNSYSKILRDEYGYDCQQLAIVNLRPNGKYRIFRIPEFRERTDKMFSKWHRKFTRSL